MRNLLSIYTIHILLFTGICTLFSCGQKTEEGEIQELDKKYLSESQLFALNRAIDDDPDNAENYYKRSKVYLDKQQPLKALKDIDQAIKIDNDEGKFFLLQARAYEALHQFPNALKAGLTAETLKANQPEVKMLLAKLYLKSNQKDKAKEYLNIASLLTPHHAEISFLSAKLAAVNGDTLKAIAGFFETIKKDTINTDAYKELSSIYFNKHKYDSSMVFAARGRAIEPEDPFFYYMDGRFLEHMNLKESARVSFQNCVKFDPTFSEAYRSLAMMSYKEENLEKAAGYFEKELKYNPNSLRSNMYLAEIYEKQNKGQMAIPLLERVVALDSLNTKAKTSLDKLYVLYPKKVTPDPVKDSVATIKPGSTADSAVKKPNVKPAAKDSIKSPQKNNSGKPSDSPKEIKKLRPTIKNPDSTKIDVRPDTVK